MRRVLAIFLLLWSAALPAQINVPGAPSLGGSGFGVPGAPSLGQPGFSVPASTAPVITAITGPSTTLGTETAGTGYAEGWTATYATTPPLNPLTTFAVVRQGYTTSGTTTNYTDTFTATMAIRQAYPASTVSSYVVRADKLVALSDYVYVTDSPPSGVTNGSTITSPKPLCNFSAPSRTNINGSLYAEAVCFHRNARSGAPVPAVVFTAVDVGSAHTGTCTASAPAVSTLFNGNANGDRNAVVVYGCTITAAWNAGLVTLNAKAYPWIGAAASVADSSASSVLREFSPRYYLQTTAAPVYAYLCPSVNVGSCPVGAATDATGLWSTNAAVAAATPFLTLKGAIDNVTAARNTAATSSKLDNLVIRVSSGGATGGGGAAAAVTQNIGNLVVTRDPAVTQANAVLNFATAFRPKISTGLTAPVTEGAITFTDMKLVRTASANLFQGEATASLTINLINVLLDSGGFNASFSTLAGLNIYGVTASNMSGTSPLGGGGTGQNRTIRGLQNYTASLTSVEQWLNLGNSMSSAQLVTPSTADKSIVAFNDFHMASTPSSDIFNVGFTENFTSGLALVQNLFEIGHTSTVSPTSGISRDSAAAGSMKNAIVWNNTFTGFGILVGRQNTLYDSTIGTNRFHTLTSWVGNLETIMYSKGDFFVAGSGGSPADAPNHLGSFAYIYGAGVSGELERFVDTSSGGVGTAADRNFVYAGPGSTIGTSSTTETVDPLFVTNKSTTSGPTAGTMTSTSFGDYHIGSSSPCKGKVAVAVLPVGLDGTTRSATGDACGVYP